MLSSSLEHKKNAFLHILFMMLSSWASQEGNFSLMPPLPRQVPDSAPHPDEMLKIGLYLFKPAIWYLERNTCFQKWYLQLLKGISMCCSALLMPEFGTHFLNSCNHLRNQHGPQNEAELYIIMEHWWINKKSWIRNLLLKRKTRVNLLLGRTLPDHKWL